MADDIWIELRGLQVLARIGVTDAELEHERTLLIDIDVVAEGVAATETDEIADTVDYAEVAAVAEAAARECAHRTLERLAAKIADRVLAVGGCEEVGVRIAKPDPPMEQRIEQVAVRVARGAA